MRLSKRSDLQQIDSLPHKKHLNRLDAEAEAIRLTTANPNARGFVVLESIVEFNPVITAPKDNTLSQRIKSLEAEVEKLKSMMVVPADWI